MDARYADLSMIGRDQHYHVNLNIFNFHHQINYFLDGTNNRRAVRTWTYKEHKLTEKPPGHHWHICVKPQRILDLWRYGCHWSNSRGPPLLLSLIKHPSPSVFLSLCCWSLSLFPRLQLYFRFVNVTPHPRSEIRAPNFSHSSVCDECLRRKLNTCLSVLEIPFLSFPKHISNDLFYRTDATAGFASEAATYLIWPKLANEMATVGVWIANLENSVV